MKTTFLSLCFVFTLPLHAVLSGEPEGGKLPGRYQLTVGPTIDGKTLLYRIDSQTGKVWFFDPLKFDGWDEEKMKAAGVSPEKIKAWEAQGWMVTPNAHWEEVPERVEGSQLHPTK